MQSIDGDEIHVGDTVWFTDDGHEEQAEQVSSEESPMLDSARVVGLDERDEGLVVETGQGRELIGLYTVHFVQPEPTE